MQQDAQVPAAEAEAEIEQAGGGVAQARDQGRGQARGALDDVDQIVEQVALGEHQRARFAQGPVKVIDPGVLRGGLGQREVAAPLVVVVVGVGGAAGPGECIGQGRVRGGVDVEREGQRGQVVVQRCGPRQIGGAEVLHREFQGVPALLVLEGLGDRREVAGVGRRCRPVRRQVRGQRGREPAPERDPAGSAGSVAASGPSSRMQVPRCIARARRRQAWSSSASVGGSVSRSTGGGIMPQTNASGADWIKAR